MAERNNNLMICSLLSTEPAGRDSGGRLAAAARTIFVRAIPWRNQALVEIPLEPQPWVARLRPRYVRITAPRRGPRGQARSLKFETQMENCYLKPQGAASLWIGAPINGSNTEETITATAVVGCAFGNSWNLRRENANPSEAGESSRVQVWTFLSLSSAPGLSPEPRALAFPEWHGATLASPLQHGEHTVSLGLWGLSPG